MEQKISKTYFPNLDSTRFLAFLPVFLTHCFFSNTKEIQNSKFYLFVFDHLKLGLLGLDYFFVLSGFLITWIIIEEQNKTSKFSLKNFYVRRGLRIFPLYFLMVIVGFLISFLNNNFGGGKIIELPSFIYFLSFTLNFYIIENGKDFLFFLVFFWSVSVEEQFYFFWSILLKFLKRHIPVLAFAMIVFSVVFRAFYIENDNQLVFNTISSLSNFGVGALIAHFSFFYESFVNVFQKVPRILIALVYITFLILFYNYNKLFCYKYSIIFERLIFSLFFGFFILEQVYSNKSIYKIGRIKFMDYFGKLSFGLYCYHGLIITLYIKFIEDSTLMKNWFWVFFLAPVLLFFSTIITAHLSYVLIEKKIVLLKNKFY